MNELDPNKRELLQLWYVADYYMKLAEPFGEECKQIAPDKTVRNLADECENWEKINGNNVKPFVLLNANISSAGARFVAIDENTKLKGRHDSRLKEYDDNIGTCVNFKKRLIGKGAKQAVIETKDRTVHFVLRHLVCHAELKNCLEIIGELKCLDLYAAMTTVKKQHQERP